MHYALNLAFHGWLDRDDESSVAHGGGDILIDMTLSLSRTQYGIESARNIALHLFLFETDVEQSGGCLVLDMAELVEYSLYAPYIVAKGEHLLRQGMKVGVGGSIALILGGKELLYLGNGDEASHEVEEFLFLHVGTL